MKIDYLELLRQQRENCVKEYESYYAGSKEDFAPQCVINSIRNAAIPPLIDLSENEFKTKYVVADGFKKLLENK